MRISTIFGCLHPRHYTKHNTQHLPWNKEVNSQPQLQWEAMSRGNRYQIYDLTDRQKHVASSKFVKKALLKAISRPTVCSNKADNPAAASHDDPNLHTSVNTWGLPSRTYRSATSNSNFNKGPIVIISDEDKSLDFREDFYIKTEIEDDFIDTNVKEEQGDRAASYTGAVMADTYAKAAESSSSDELGSIIVKEEVDIPLSPCPAFPSEEEASSSLAVELPMVIPPNDVDANELLNIVETELTKRLPQNWVCFVDDNGIHVMQLSKKFEKNIQRRLFFTPSGEAQLSVHCCPLPISNYADCANGVQLSNEMAIDSFVTWIMHMREAIQKFEICTGVSEEEYKHLWADCSDGEIDENPYQEDRFSLTYRSKNCKRLVDASTMQCSSCSSLATFLSNKASEAGSNLTEKEIDLQLRQQSAELRRLRTKLRRQMKIKEKRLKSIQEAT